MGALVARAYGSGKAQPSGYQLLGSVAGLLGSKQQCC
jgi:hypothetical protein